MRILHVLPSIARSYGGPTASLLGYVRASRAAGLEVEVASPAPPPDDAAWWRREAPELVRHTFPSVGGGAFVTSPALAAWVWQSGARFDVLHVHALQNPVSSSAMWIAARRGWPFLVRTIGMLSDFTFTHRRRALKQAWFRGIDRRLIAACAGLHFTTEGERDEGAPRSGGARAFVVPPPWVGAPIVRRPGGPPRLVCVARLHRVKNLEAALRGWARARRPDGAELVVAGDGDDPYRRELEGLARELGVADSVRFVGFVAGAAKDELFATARASFLLSKHENFGVAILEAAAAGLPCVVSPEVHLAPFVRAHGLGDVVDAASPELVARSFERALTDEALQAHCAQRGPGAVAEEFSLEAIGAKLARMYTEAKAAR
jgi:glycosyltransferase involved in cell wall biosynthesis